MDTEKQYLSTLCVANLACSLHLGHFRRDGTTPYFKHLDEVVKRVGTSDALRQIAYLHDSIEDEKTTSDDLLFRRVAPGVVECVKRLTHKKGETYFDYIRRVQECPMATRVKIADILANLSDSPTPRQIRKYANALLMLVTNDK